MKELVRTAVFVLMASFLMAHSSGGCGSSEDEDHHEHEGVDAGTSDAGL